MSVWTQPRFQGWRRHVLGLWLPSAKLASRAYVPNAADRRQLVGGRPTWVVFGGPTGDVTIPASQWQELRQVVHSDFIVYTLLISTTVGGTAANPGVRAQIRDLSTQPGKMKRFSIMPVDDICFAGSAQHPLFLRVPYRFRAGHTIAVRLQNLQASSNNVQFVMHGVSDE